jgi:predicted tellurium resistance membrane protein TerC
MQELLTTAALTSIVTLTLLEIVLGVDNIIFISIITGKLEQTERKKARTLGLAMAAVIRIGLLFVLGWILSLQKDLFNLKDLGLPIDMGFSGKDMILLLGGLFLIYKTTTEIHHKLEGEEEDITHERKAMKWSRAVLDITLINIVFSLDSIITAVGLTDKIAIMAIAVVLSTIVMMLFAGKVGDFVEKHPTIKILALSFLIMIGTMLVAEAFHFHVEKGYVYFAMLFSFGVEIINMQYRTKRKPVDLRDRIK